MGHRAQSIFRTGFNSSVTVECRTAGGALREPWRRSRRPDLVRWALLALAAVFERSFIGGSSVFADRPGLRATRTNRQPPNESCRASADGVLVEFAGKSGGHSRFLGNQPADAVACVLVGRRTHRLRCSSGPAQRTIAGVRAHYPIGSAASRPRGARRVYRLDALSTNSVLAPLRPQWRLCRGDGLG